MFKIYTDKINIIKTREKYRTNGILKLFKPLMSNVDNYAHLSEIQLNRLLRTIENGDVVLFNSPYGISFKDNKRFNIITVNYMTSNEIIINKKQYNIIKVTEHIEKTIRLLKIRNLMRC